MAHSTNTTMARLEKAVFWITTPSKARKSYLGDDSPNSHGLASPVAALLHKTLPDAKQT